METGSPQSELFCPETTDLIAGTSEFKAENARLAEAEYEATRTHVRHMPPWINLTGTTVCNLKCYMCNQAYDDLPRWTMGESVYRKVVQELYPYVQTVQFSAFGEPLMTPGLYRKFDDLENTNTKLEIITNATLMHDEKLRNRLLDVLEMITFSMDGATKETYDAVRVGADFDRVLANIEAFCQRRLELPEEKRPRLQFNSILMERTIREAGEFVELAHRLGADQVVFNHVVVFHPDLERESLQFNRELANRHIAEARKLGEELGVSVVLPPEFNLNEPQPERRVPDPSPTNGEASCAETTPKAPEENGEGALENPRDVFAETEVPSGPGRMPRFKCMFLWKRAYIGPHGQVVPCCVAGAPSVGNMMDQPFREIWNNETYQKMRERVFTPHPYGPCKNCYLIYTSPDEADREAFLKF
ncbi:MAG: SPASM domain-containing protein [Planctomycetota bacterium]